MAHSHAAPSVSDCCCQRLFNDIDPRSPRSLGGHFSWGSPVLSSPKDRLDGSMWPLRAMRCARVVQVIELHSRCLLNIMRFGLMERLKALSMVAIITWTSREACGRIAGALARHCGGHAPAEVTADMLLAIVRIPDFVEGIDRAERDFTEVLPPHPPPLLQGISEL